MIIILKKGTVESDIKKVESKVHDFGLRAHQVRGEFLTVICVIGDERKMNIEQVRTISCVESVLPVLKPYKLASREFQSHDTVIDLDGAKIGGEHFGVIAGPCAIETEEQYLETARKVKSLGFKFLRGSVFKPRTSPYDFQGLREEGIDLIRKARKETGLKIVTEVMDVRQVSVLEECADILQVGSRNMQNFDLLREVGRCKKPVLLKRGMAATVKEFIMAAEYIMSEGNHRVILCERGIKTFETATRNTLDINAVPVVKRESHLPIIIDPSHSTGDRDFVIPISRAALAAGADGLIVEVHPNPEKAMCDGAQSITLAQLAEMARQLKELAPVLGRKV